MRRRVGPDALGPVTEEVLLAAGVRSRSLCVPGSGAPILLLHGFSDSADTWRPVLRELARRGQQAVAVDLPGFGRADDLAPGPVLPQLDAFVADLVRGLADRCGQDVTVVGNSLGGTASLRAAQRTDLPLRGVVPVSPAGFGHSWVLEKAERLAVTDWVLAKSVVPAPVLRTSLRYVFPLVACGRPRHADHAAVQAYSEHFRSRQDVRRLLGGSRSVLTEVRAAYDLTAVRVPVLLVWGRRDRLTLSRGASRLIDAVPGSRLVSLRDCGHCPQIEAPDRVATLVLGFVQEHEHACPPSAHADRQTS